MAEQAFSMEFSIEEEAWSGHVPALERALVHVAREEGATGEVSVLLADDAYLQQLNRDWRGKDKPTNVLSFPALKNEAGLLGDIALSFETAQREAADQGKSFEAHAAHLIVHGFLHLLGYDHEVEDEAEAMEGRERAVLAGLGFADPYAERDGERVTR